MKLSEALAVGVRGLPPEVPLTEAKEELLGRPLVDPLGDDPRVELGEQGGELGRRLRLVRQKMRPKPAMELVVEVLWVQVLDQVPDFTKVKVVPAHLRG